MAKKTTNKNETLNDALEFLEEKYGPGVAFAGDSFERVPCEAIPTGIMTVDHALGVGGIPIGRLTEIFGPEGCGKTTLALHVAAEAQKLGYVAAFIDVEHALDPTYAEHGIGVDMSKLIISQPDYGEQALDIVQVFCQNPAVNIVILDSVAALMTKAEIEGELEDQKTAEVARLMSKSCKKIAKLADKGHTAVIFINQLRDKISFGMGPSTHTPGGRALKYFASSRIEIKRVATLRDSAQKPKGHTVRAKIVKHKVARPFLEAEFDIMYDGRGASSLGCLIDLGVKEKLLTKAGNWLSYKDIKLGNGKEQAVNALRIDTELAEQLKKDVLGKLKPEPEPEPEPVKEIKSDAEHAEI